MNKDDLARRGLKDGDRIDIRGLVPEEAAHLVRGFTAVEFNIPKGSVAGYYPEMNAVVSLRHYDRLTGTPSYKGATRDGGCQQRPTGRPIPDTALTGAVIAGRNCASQQHSFLRRSTVITLVEAYTFRLSTYT